MLYNLRRADLLWTYDEEIMPALASTLDRILALNPDAKALISATLRNEKTLDAFMNACSKSLHSLMFQKRTSFENLSDVSGLRAQRLQVPLPREDSQTGFFFSTTTPILVFLITRYMDDIPSSKLGIAIQSE